MSINIELHVDFFSHLNIELPETVGPKDVEHHLMRILLMGFDDKTLCLPFGASTG